MASEHTPLQPTHPAGVVSPRANQGGQNAAQEQLDRLTVLQDVASADLGADIYTAEDIDAQDEAVIGWGNLNAPARKPEEDIRAASQTETRRPLYDDAPVEYQTQPSGENPAETRQADPSVQDGDNTDGPAATGAGAPRSVAPGTAIDPTVVQDSAEAGADPAAGNTPDQDDPPAQVTASGAPGAANAGAAGTAFAAALGFSIPDGPVSGNTVSGDGASNGNAGGGASSNNPSDNASNGNAGGGAPGNNPSDNASHGNAGGSASNGHVGGSASGNNPSDNASNGNAGGGASGNNPSDNASNGNAGGSASGSNPSDNVSNGNAGGGAGQSCSHDDYNGHDIGAQDNHGQGLSGHDVIHGTADDEHLVGGACADELYGDGGDDRLTGSAGDDLLFGGTGDDRLDGDAGNDRLQGDTGNDTLRGGAGDDTAVYSGAFSDYVISENQDGSYTVEDTVDGRDGVDTVHGIEFFQFSDQTLATEALPGDSTTASPGQRPASAGTAGATADLADGKQPPDSSFDSVDMGAMLDDAGPGWDDAVNHGHQSGNPQHDDTGRLDNGENGNGNGAGFDSDGDQAGLADDAAVFADNSFDPMQANETMSESAFV